MKIILLCGSLESGHDGVGDYTMRLCGELIRQGHDAAVVALNDKHVTEVYTGMQEIDGVRVSVFRIPYMWSTKKRFSQAKEWINVLKPDWLSLQFVPFSFHPKGLPIGFISKMKSLVRGYNFHIMFHELWVGVNGNERLKMRLLGLLQKIIIKQLLSNSKPNCITTTIAIYKERLSNSLVEILPLFGNIPLVFCNKSISNVDKLKVVHFGSFTGLTEEYKSQLQFLNKAAAFYNRRVEFITFGEGGIFKDKAIKIAKSIFGEKQVIERGRLSAPEISMLLQTADVGVSRANYTMSGKSGCTIAMLEHGLPVVLRGTKPYINDNMDSDLSHSGQLLFCNSGFSAVLQRRTAKSNLSSVAETFVAYLSLLY